MGYDDLIEYCRKNDKGEPNDFTYGKIIDCLKSYPEEVILIPDTLGTKMVADSEVVSFDQNDGLVRVRDEDHPYAYFTEEIRWAIIDFAKEGRLKIFVKELHSFADTIMIDESDKDD